MAIELKLRQGSTSDHTSFTGAQGEVTVEFPVDGNGDPDAAAPLPNPGSSGFMMGALPVDTSSRPETGRILSRTRRWHLL